MAYDTSKFQSLVDVLSVIRICKWWCINCSLVIVIQLHHLPLSAILNRLSHLSNLPFLCSVSGWSTKHVKSALCLVLERVLLLTWWELFLSLPFPMTIYSPVCIWLLPIPSLWYNEGPWGLKGERGSESCHFLFWCLFPEYFVEYLIPALFLWCIWQHNIRWLHLLCLCTRRKNILYRKTMKLYTLQLNIQVWKWTFLLIREKKKLETVSVFMWYFIYHGPEGARVCNFTGLLKYMSNGYLKGIPHNGDAKVPSSKQWINPCYIIFSAIKGKVKRWLNFLFF